jgi:phosphatidylglycerophosphatase A
MKKNIAEWIGTVFYLGKLPLAPGTWTSLVATIVWYFIFKDLNVYFLPMVTFLLFILGIISSNVIIKDSKEHDPSKIVIDEWVGQWLAFTLLPVTIQTGLIGFLAFRFFDILKPGPVKKMEKLPKGLGVMADDVMAGILAYFIIKIYYLTFS